MKLSDKPKVSVIMAVYNNEKTLCEAIDSILDQTYINWEFVICNDGSTDKTQDILNLYKEKYPNKIILLKNNTKKYLSFSLNRCLEHSSGELIARMDGDDKSVSSRLEKQVMFLKMHPEYQVVGTMMRRFNDRGEFDIIPVKEKPDRYVLKKGVPFCHATIMMYKDTYIKLNGYRVSEMTKRSQDYDMWFRFYQNGFAGYNLQEPLYFVREDMNAIRRRTFNNRYNIMKIQFNGYRLLGFPKSWYLYPVINFGKAFLPGSVMLLFRKVQSKLKQ